ncbi:MAG TPA: cytochrome b/b6 domain-containing protein [Hyphomicrobiales bacterium]|nr:cytochrome b/b6 domain-containing protein [Hyphomicrobiales bacterium]
MQDRTFSGIRPVKVWDIYTRLFHWALGIAILVSFISANQGEMEIHTASGIIVLGLLAFRLLWGVLGSRTAQFHRFIRGPKTIIAYIRNSKAPRFRPMIGHSPIGALSVIALLVLVAVQGATGLFASDDIYTEGPLVKFVSSNFNSLATEIHKANSNLLLMLIGLHVAAVLYYLFVRREDLILPMITGRKQVSFHDATQAEPVRERNPLLAIAAITAASALAYYIYTI